MARHIWFANSKARLEGNQRHSMRCRPASQRRSAVRLAMERLEDRLVLSGFGPEDGAYVIDPHVGVFNDVRIQPTDQAIMTAGRMVLGSSLAEVVARFDSQGNVDAADGNGGVATTALRESF